MEPAADRHLRGLAHVKRVERAGEEARCPEQIERRLDEWRSMA